VAPKEEIDLVEENLAKAPPDESTIDVTN